jgi:hypothetical protein
MPAQKQKLQIDSELLRQRLKLRSISTERKLLQNHPVAASFFEKIGLRPGKIRDHTAKVIATGALAGTLLLAAHSSVNPTKPTISQNNSLQTDAGSATNPRQLAMADFLQTALPKPGQWELQKDTEKQISEKIRDLYGLKATAELDGNRLNFQYGRMGAEQHLIRYPGDSIAERQELRDKGVAPGLGAWGYFAPSRDRMTPELYETEKWYVAVQTLYLPDWATKQPYLKDWYKYRRVVVVNPANGKMVVAAVADAGPSIWTGKHFGGSPKLMEYLGINYGKQNHPVVLLFLDDPEKAVPLGPVEYNVEEYKRLTKNLA